MDDQDPRNLHPVQGGAVTNVWDRSDTELARAVAAHEGWLFGGDYIYDAKGVFIARSVEDLAAVLADTQIIMPPHSIFWSQYKEIDLANYVRERLDGGGRHSSLIH